jgi:hypothetical protein
MLITTINPSRKLTVSLPIEVPLAVITEVADGSEISKSLCSVKGGGNGGGDTTSMCMA